MKRCTKTMKCPKTMSGKHIWGPIKLFFNKNLPYCLACNIVDDRPKKEKK